MGFIIPLLLGVVFIVVGIGLLRRHQRVAAEGVHTTAKIVDLVVKRERNSDGKYRTYYYPVIKFRDQQGDEIVQKLNYSTIGKKVNDSLPVVYLKENDGMKIVINSLFYMKVFPSLFIGIGGLACIVGLIGLLRHL